MINKLNEKLLNLWKKIEKKTLDIKQMAKNLLIYKKKRKAKIELSCGWFKNFSYKSKYKKYLDLLVKHKKN